MGAATEGIQRAGTGGGVGGGCVCGYDVDEWVKACETTHQR